MILIYLICFVLVCVGIAFILDLTPENIADDMMQLVVPKQTLKDKVSISHGKKKTRRITTEIVHIKDALSVAGKSNLFTVIIAMSVLLMVVGCILAAVIGNMFLVPIFAIAFASIPFLYAKSTISAFDKHVKDELETALSIITTSYIRSNDIISAVSENVVYLKPPMRDIFQGFVGQATMVSSDIKGAIRSLKAKVDNEIFKEWCDTLIACQDDRTLNDTLLPIVSKLTDVRIVNNELKTILSEVKNEYFVMVALVFANIPILYMLNKEWYEALMYSLLGKIVLAICALVILITSALMMKYTKPIKYSR